MTLEEAIKRFEKLASDYEFNLDMHHRNVMKLSVNDIERMQEYLEENKQLAEWLRELKAYREARKEITRKMNSGQWSEGVVYGLDKAVRIMEKHLREVNANG